MIDLVKSSDGKGLFIRVTPRWPLKESIRLDFYRAGASEIETALIEQHLDALIADSTEALRKVSYLRGWRDAKSKRRKADGFTSGLVVDEWEKKEAGL